MRNGKALLLCVTGCFLLVVLGAGAWLMSERPDVDTESYTVRADTIPENEDAEACTVETEDAPQYEGRKTGPMKFGRFLGEVSYDEEKDLYFLQLRGARFPFKSSPLEAQSVLLDASGKTPLEKNTSLLYTILGKDVLHATLLINPEEEDEVMPAAIDIARYIQMVNRRKFAGVAYTKEGGKLEGSVVRGAQIQALEDATSKTPIVQIKGPKSGASRTAVSVNGRGQVIVEGKTHEDLYSAADLICVTLLKMLCGSPECPDAAACATGGDCGCG